MNYEYKPTSWSFSALHTYEECPLNYVLGRLSTKERSTSWALEEGLRIHGLMEHYLLGNITGIPADLHMFEKELKTLKKKGAETEEEIVLDKKWKPLKVKDPWRSKQAWIRAKLDAKLDNLVIDLKTGREYEYYAEQGNLYATLIMETTDYADVTVEFWYTKTGNIVTHGYSRNTQEERVAKWKRRADKLMKEKHWLPKTCLSCRWCDHHEACELQDV